MENFSKIYLVTTELETVLAMNVKTVERQLKTTFPLGYKEYITELGTGLFCDYFYVYPPQKVLEDFALYQKTFQEYYHLWSESHSLITKEDIGKLIVFAHTDEMDKVAFHSKDPTRVFVVPYSYEVINDVGSNLYEALDWVYELGVPDDSDFRWFDSSVNQRYCKMQGNNWNSLLSDFYQYISPMGLQIVKKEIHGKPWLFVRDFNGYMTINTKDVAEKAKIYIKFDKDLASVPNGIKLFFEKRGFEVFEEGDKKK